MKKIVLIILIFASSLQLISQELKGSVRDVFKKPIENAYVYNVTSNAHTHTDVNGSF